MTRTHRFEDDLLADPFRERAAHLQCEDFQVLGGLFRFETASPPLLQLVRSAFADLPAHRMSNPAPRFRIRLELTPSRKPQYLRGEPPPLNLFSGAGYLCGAIPSSSFVVVSPDERKALVVVSPEMARSAYHTRYELIELVAYLLAARCQKLISLHAGCVGLGRRGLLLVGTSGSGKSTLALHCMLDGFDLISEDSVLVSPSTLHATGLANFLHIQRDGLRFLTGTAHAASIRSSPVIRRRSGVKKLEVDLRRLGVRLANAPVKAAAVIITTEEKAEDGGPLLKPLRKAELTAHLRATQAYAANSPGWNVFRKNISGLPSFELRRGRHPRESVLALRKLVSSPTP